MRSLARGALEVGHTIAHEQGELLASDLDRLQLDEYTAVVTGGGAPCWLCILLLDGTANIVHVGTSSGTRRV